MDATTGTRENDCSGRGTRWASCAPSPPQPLRRSRRAAHWLGTVAALFVPALAVATLEIPNIFQDGDIVSASLINENFEALRERTEQRPTIAANTRADDVVIEEGNVPINYLSIDVTKPAGVAGHFHITATAHVSTTAAGDMRSVVAHIERTPDGATSLLGTAHLAITPMSEVTHTNTMNTSALVPVDADTTNDTFYLNFRENGIGDGVFTLRRAWMMVMFVPD